MNECDSPVSMPWWVMSKTGRGLANDYFRCRKCAPCLVWRQSKWIRRCEIEFLSHHRTWWVTLTYRGAKEPDYDDVKKFFKKLRKAGHVFRYVCSEERGSANDRMHWHLLLHCDDQLGRRKLASAWGFGHTNERLARSAGLGGYLAKYLSKSSKIRASVYYGNSEHALHRIDEALGQELEEYLVGGDDPDYAQYIEFGYSGVNVHVDFIRKISIERFGTNLSINNNIHSLESEETEQTPLSALQTASCPF